MYLFFKLLLFIIIILTACVAACLLFKPKNDCQIWMISHKNNNIPSIMR